MDLLNWCNQFYGGHVPPVVMHRGGEELFRSIANAAIRLAADLFIQVVLRAAYCGGSQRYINNAIAGKGWV